MDIKVSLIASAVRTSFYKSFLDSLRSTTISYEIIFAGHNTVEEIEPFKKQYPEFKYVHTGKIKPSQCYEIARRNSIGELVLWTADDAEHTPDIIGKAYNYWKSLNNEKILLSIQTLENGMLCNMLDHSFFGWHRNSPLMAPLGMMSRTYLEKLGGFDRRYVCGQYENAVAMQVWHDGGEVKVFGDRQNCIVIDHYRKHGIKRPFATGYNKDREVLEGSWVKDGKASLIRNDVHEPYEDADILTKSQSNKGQWE